MLLKLFCPLHNILPYFILVLFKLEHGACNAKVMASSPTEKHTKNA